MRMKYARSKARRKKAVNLSVDAELLGAARKQGLNLSSLLERALEQEQTGRWLEGNRQAIEASNQDVRQNGMWSDGLRPW
jgi:antitoxin CcdA